MCLIMDFEIGNQKHRMLMMRNKDHLCVCLYETRENVVLRCTYIYIHTHILWFSLITMEVIQTYEGGL